MGRPIRVVESERLYLLTNRCIFGMHLMRPDAEVRRIILGCLARAADKFDVEIVCFCFLSNHFHLIAGFPELNMAEFMEQLQGQIARRINDHWGRSGQFFGQRYDDQALLDDQVVRDKIAYVLNNPLKHGLVTRAGAWPGVSSMEAHRNGTAVEGQWLNGETWGNLCRRKGEYDRQEAMETYSFELHLPEALEGDGEAERRERLLEVVDEDRRREWAERSGREDRAPHVCGAEAVYEQHWSDRPDDPPSGPFQRRRLAVAAQPERLRAYLEERAEIQRAYRKAVSLWRDREVGDFPPGTYPPGWRHCVGSPARAERG